jgi:hypothetical protein
MVGNLEALPREVLDNICRHTSRRTLFNLSLVNRLWAQLTERYRFSHVRLEPTCSRDLDRGIKHWEDILSVNNRFRYVRRVTVFGVMKEDAAFEYIPTDRLDSNKIPGFWDDEEDIEKDDLTHDIDMYVQEKDGSDYDLDRDRNEAWLPLASFLLERVTNLEDMVYTCPQQIPTCVLSVLRRRHPTCRLHVSYVRFRDVIKQTGTSRDMDPTEEDALLTSPCLYSIRIIDDLDHENDDDDYAISATRMEEVVVRVIQSGRAPRLRHIYNGASRASEFELTVQQPVPSSEARTSRQLAELHTLRFTNQFYTAESLAAWANVVDFSTIRNFEYVDVDIDKLQLLVSGVNGDDKAWFRALRSLHLTFRYYTSDMTTPSLREHMSKMESLAVDFFSFLPPLEMLSLECFITPWLLETILSHHGPMLRRLFLPSNDTKLMRFFDANKIHDLARRCPRLQDLKLRVSRYRGGRKEVAAYHAIGQIPQLRRVELMLGCDGEVREDVTNAPPLMAAISSDIIPLSAEATEEVRKVILNLATDKRLAREIWDAITKRGPTKLEGLLIRPDWNAALYLGRSRLPPRLVDWAHWIGRHWVCKKAQRLSDNGEPRVDVEVREQVTELYPHPSRMHRVVDTNGVDVWETMWPSKGGNWWDEWESCPLQTGTEVQEDEGVTA